MERNLCVRALGYKPVPIGVHSPSGDDDVVLSRREPDVSVLVHLGAVTREVIVAGEGVARLGRIPDVVLEQSRRFVGPAVESDVTLLAPGHLLAHVVHDTDVVARSGLAHRTGSDRHSWTDGRGEIYRDEFVRQMKTVATATQR